MKEWYLSKTPFLTFVYISKCNINLPCYFGNSKKKVFVNRSNVHHGEVFSAHYSINITFTILFVNITAGMLTCVKKKSRRSQRKKFCWGGEAPPPQLRRTSLIRDFFKESIIRFLCLTNCLSSQYSPSRWSVLYRSLSQFHGLKIWMSRLYSVFYQNCPKSLSLL